MLLRKDVETLEPGDVIEHWALFPKVTDEPLKLTVIENHIDKVSVDNVHITFRVTFMDVLVGIVDCFGFQEEHLEWKMAEVVNEHQ